LSTLIPQIRAVSVISGKVFLRFLRSPLLPFLCVSGFGFKSWQFWQFRRFWQSCSFSYNS